MDAYNLAALGRLPAEVAATTTRLLERFDQACSGHSLALPPPLAASAARVFAASPFTAETAIRWPQAFLGLLAKPSQQDSPTALRARVDAGFEGLADEDALRAYMRRVRQVELARLAWADLLEELPLPEVLARISALADALVDGCARWLAADLAPRFGAPCDEQGRAVGLVVVGMGKLGGGELNFSSDIDLIFAYRASGETAGGARSLSNQEYFDRLGKRFIAALNDVTHDGFVYRVDMRLRPFGDAGSLTASFAALEQYYLLHGRDWERYALVKARVIHGDAADAELLADITKPFVYRRYLDFGAFESVRSMKAMIDAEIARDGLTGDIKRGAGGIREVEFIVQAFQLVRGGRERRLRENSLGPALAMCGELGLLSAGDVTALRAAYEFLRTTEHRLQQVHDQQTQTLPEREPERSRLAFAAGFPNWDTFAAALSGHRAAVRQRFESFLLPTPAPVGRRDAAGTLAEAAWRSPADAEGLGEQLAGLGFEDIAEASRQVRDLKDGRFISRLSNEARERLDRLMPRLLVECAARPAGALVLSRIGMLLRAVARRSVYLALLADNGVALGRLVALCEQSSWVAEQIAHWPILLDELLDARLLNIPPKPAELQGLLDDALDTVDGQDLERVMEILRVFKHQQVLRVAACDLMTGHPIAEVSNHLTSIAEQLVGKALAIAWRDLVTRHGRPRHRRDGHHRPAGFAVIAYGKLGGRELGYSSDLDLVFVHDSGGVDAETDGPRAIANDVFFTRLAQRLIHLLTTPTPAGTAYELDVRLRPSGASGLLVTSLDAFREYQLRSAWTWEHQALVRARGLRGDAHVLAGFEQVRREVLGRARDASALRAEIREMREKMRLQIDRSNAERFDLKQGPGGITDIEFMVQYLCLRWAHEHPVLSAYTDNLRLLDLTVDLALLPRDDSRLLQEAYFAYRAEVHRCALQEVDGLLAQDALQSLRQGVREVWQKVMFE